MSRQFGLVSRLKQCTTVFDTKKAHAECAETLDTHVANTLVSAYMRCKSPHDADCVFQATTHRTCVSWNALLLGYAGLGMLHESSIVFTRMPSHDVVTFTGMMQCYSRAGEHGISYRLASTCGFPADARLYVAVFNACSGLANKETVKFNSLDKGMKSHLLFLSSGIPWDMYLINALIDMYASCGSVYDARHVFDTVPCHDVVTFNTLMLGYVENGEEHLSLKLFGTMTTPNSRSYVAAIKACTSLRLLEQGRVLHEQAVEANYDTDAYVACALVNMYASCGCMVDAKRVFDTCSHHDIVLSNTLLMGYVENGQPELALEMFVSMIHEPDALAYVSALKAGSQLLCLEKGMELHIEAESDGFICDIFVSCTLIDLYTKCGTLWDARAVFDKMPAHNVVAWNTLLFGCVENAEERIALDLFHSMTCTVDTGSFVAALKACTHLATKDDVLTKGTAVHSRASQLGLQDNPLVASALIDMYINCGELGIAEALFQKARLHKDTVCVTSMMMGYMERGYTEEALELFKSVRLECFLDARIYSAALRACARGGSRFETGKELHSDICRLGMDKDVSLVVSLLDFYGKSGSTRETQFVFDSADDRNTGTWNGLIHGTGEHGLQSFQSMQEEGVRADTVTFMVVLTACSRGGHVEKAREVFQEMVSKYGVPRVFEHYVCMIDVLSRGNRIQEAVEMVNTMPYKPNAVVWTVVLTGCYKWGNVALGKAVFESLMNLQTNGEQHSGAYNLIANTFCKV